MQRDYILYFYENAFKMHQRRLEGIFSVAREKAWHVEAIAVDGVRTHPRKVIAFWHPTGVIVDGGVLSHNGYGPDAFSGVPSVFCDVDTDRISAPYFGVQHDSRETARKATEEILALGYDNYAFVHYRTKRDWTLEREAVMRECAVGKNVFSFEAWRSEHAADVTTFHEKLSRFLLRLPRPCGVFAANDETASHVLLVAARCGITVPEEISVVGIDNDELLCENVDPTLTSVAPDFIGSGRLAAELLARRIDEPSTPPVVIAYGSAPLVRRRSTRPAAARDIRILKALEFIRLNACEGISVKDVLSHAGLSARAAEIRFKSFTGHAIRDEIASVRIARAMECLADARLPVGGIHAACGYANERTFRAAFTKATGVSPRAWRERRTRGAGTDRTNDLSR